MDDEKIIYAKKANANYLYQTVIWQMMLNVPMQDFNGPSQRQHFSHKGMLNYSKLKLLKTQRKQIIKYN